MVSLLGSPLPKGGSRGARPEVCAMAPAVNAEANAIAKTNFFTIFSVVFRGVEQAMDGLNGSYHHSRPAELSVLLLFVAVVFRFGGWLPAKKSRRPFGAGGSSHGQMR